MTRKHYKELASIIKIGSRIQQDYVSEEFLSDLCDFLKRDNINFKKYTFLKACEKEV